MNETWWVSKEQLIGEQSSVIDLPLQGSYLIKGPPGSGKTNLLLLRANYLHLAGHTNIAAIVFTRTLQEFLVAGAGQYDFPSSRIQTSVRWMSDLLRHYGRPVPDSGNFTDVREKLAQSVYTLIKEKHLGKILDAILLDEAQDYWPDEIEIFAKLASRLFVVADSRQKIYDGTDPLSLIEPIVNEVRILKHHFRNGIKICRIADGIGNDSDDYEPMEKSANYDEVARPSSVEAHKCPSLQHQIEIILNKLDVQRQAYPDELIGICCLRNTDVDEVWAAIQSSPFAAVAVLHKADDHSPFTPESRICVATVHAAKGLEFRALHLTGFERLQSFSHQRNLSFTAVTRAKTSLSLYYTEKIPTFLESALNTLNPLPSLPTVSAAFGKSKSK